MYKGRFCLLLLVFTLTILIHSILQIADSRHYSQNEALKFPFRKGNENNIPDNTNDRIFWFMQFSDLHLSQFKDSGRTPDFRRVCSSHIKIIHPDIVIVSGDITDSKFPKFKGSQQFKEEWTAYSQIIKESGVNNHTIWLDLRGNHDNFNVPSAENPKNLFKKYSVSGRNFTHSYMMTHRKSFGNYTFIGLDACPTPGLKRPLNFFGLITGDMSKSLSTFATKAQGSNQTFWFGHYPTSTIVSPGFNIRKLISETAYCYLCGHLHTLLNFVPSMYTVQPQGFLELELPDWRDGRFFRIVAVDNDLVSFVDSQLHGDEAQDWPIVLVTNPKDAGFLLPNKEPTDRIRTSTHIRILAWSNSPITRVSVTIDNVYLGNAKPATSVVSSSNSSPLFVLPFKPSELMKKGPNVHTISVVCTDTNGNSRKVEQFFTLDGTARWNFGGVQSFILLYDHATNLTAAFYLIWSVPFLTLLIARLFGRTYIFGRVCADFCQLEGLREVASDDVLFMSLMSYLTYLIFGPIFMGYLLEESFGLVFTFGVYIQNTYIPEGTIYLVEIIQQLIFTYPLTALLIVRMRRRRWCLGACFRCRFCYKSCLEFFGIVLLIVLQLTFSVHEVLLPYGWVAFFLSPGRLWLIAFALSLFIYSGRKVRARREREIMDSLTKRSINPTED